MEQLTKKKVFIDGSVGTTGLRIHERLAARQDITLITLSEEERKQDSARKKALNSCDIAFLCLPDDAARQAISMIENENVTVIDTSTAHRTNPDWAYGFAELGESYYENIRTNKRIAVPGCHATGFIALVAPLVEAGVLPKDARLVCHSISGYSGGGKATIAKYESDPGPLYKAPRQYATTQKHKHLPEMMAITGLTHAPIFCPFVCDFYSGMEVTVPLFKEDINCTMQDIKDIYAKKYTSGLVSFGDFSENGSFSAAALSGKDNLQVSVTGNEERMLLIARFDNLGKGASGAAVQCMNICMGVPVETGLEL